MKTANILIVEDNAPVALDLADTLQEAGYAISAVLNKGEKVAPWLKNDEVDLILMDVRLSGQMDGIAAVNEIKKNYSIPIIYLTAQQNAEQLQAALATHPAAYLTKPFKEVDLLAAVNLALHSRPAANPAAEENGVVWQKDNHVFLRHQNRYIKINIDDILWIEADRSYTQLHTTNENYVLALSLNTLLEKIAHAAIQRVHRSYAVNLNHIDSFTDEWLEVKKQTIPLSKSYKDSVFQGLKRI